MADRTSEIFVRDRKNAWQRLEVLLTLLDRSSLRRLNREEVRELGRIYRRTASDLAIARAESRDPKLVNYLNSLVIRAHGRIYRAEASEGGRRVRDFFARDFPRTFRRTWRYTFSAFFAFMLFFAVGFLGTWGDESFSELAGVDPFFREFVIGQQTRWWEGLNQASQVGSTAIMTNNIMVTFYAFAYGALLGLGTLYVMVTNGASIGAVLALTYRAGFGNELLTFMSGHGVLELSAIFIAGGAGMLFGTAVLFPGDLSRLDALRLRGAEAIRLLVGCIPLLVVAGVIEGFISPAPISPLVKYGVAAATFVALYTYLLLAGRDAAEERL
ncbi:MAG TPA: stage II sporulation protein M [Pyrinomonadaceae bacterium]|nr:stage II sporulation protein M [Pyrinomonadaceae bacterium]